MATIITCRLLVGVDGYELIMKKRLLDLCELCILSPEFPEGPEQTQMPFMEDDD